MVNYFISPAPLSVSLKLWRWCWTGRSNAVPWTL